MRPKGPKNLDGHHAFITLLNFVLHEIRFRYNQVLYVALRPGNFTGGSDHF